MPLPAAPAVDQGARLLLTGGRLAVPDWLLPWLAGLGGWLVWAATTVGGRTTPK